MKKSIGLLLVVLLVLTVQAAFAAYGTYDYDGGIHYEGILNDKGQPDLFGNYAFPAGDYYGGIMQGTYYGPCAFAYEGFEEATEANQDTINFGSNLKNKRIGVWYIYYGDGSWQEAQYQEGGIKLSAIKVYADGRVTMIVYSNDQVVSEVDVAVDSLSGAFEYVPMKLHISKEDNGTRYFFSSEDGQALGCGIFLYTDGNFRLDHGSEWSITYQYSDKN